MTRPLSRLTVGAAALALLFAGCSGETSTSSSGSTSAAGGEQVELTVFAAASLNESFTALGKTFEEQHPGTRVTFVFGPSSGLAKQVNEGAPVDVFASASTKNMDDVVAAGNAAAGEGAPQTFAQNTMEIAVPVDNPGSIGELADLADPQAKVALCQEQVPCGVAAGKVIDQADLTVNPVTREADVKAVLTKVELGEVDAGVVYVTDVKAAGDKVRGIAIPADVNATTDYPIAITKQATHPGQAKEFIDFVMGAEGDKVLADQGFSIP